MLDLTDIMQRLPDSTSMGKSQYCNCGCLNNFYNLFVTVI